MKDKNKKICLLLAGGTTISEKDSTAVNNPKQIEPWLEKMPELAMIGAIEPVFICGETEPLQGSVLWQKLADEIYKRFSTHSGFVVTCPAGDVLDNSLAVSFALQNLNKPVVFSGSQLPIAIKELSANKKLGSLGLKPNLINALQVATLDFGAVVLMYGGKCLRAVKARRAGFYVPDIFASADNDYFAKIDFGISLLEKFTPPATPPVLSNVYADKVLSLDYYSGFDFSLLKQAIAGCRGVLVQYFGLEKVPQSLVENLASLKIPVVFYNRFYAPKLNQENIIEVFNLTKAAALHKFIWALGQSDKPAEVRSLMNNQFCQEFLVNQ